MRAAEWEWSQLWTPSTFDWDSGRAPFASLAFVVWATIAYITTLLVLKLVMRGRDKLSIEPVMAIHNYHLCVLSLVMAIFTGSAVASLVIAAFVDPSPRS